MCVYTSIRLHCEVQFLHQNYFTINVHAKDVLAKAILVQIHKYDWQIDTDGEYICTVYMKYTIAGIMCFADAHLCPSTGYLGQI